ncbi:ATP-binding protein [Pseudonocardia benzenivorans]|uniref:ATP-binding protein n=1 Tax=Pseudonocardia benzenivorans TaxID=228005 RepID=A0ABW3VTS9_9PSEU
MTEDPLLTSLLAAVAAAPDDVPLRLHVAELLAAARRPAEALAHCSHVLAVEPGNAAALALLQRLTTALSAATPPAPAQPSTFDWAKAEEQVADIAAPAFAQDASSPPVEDVEIARRPTVRLADVGGMDEVKQRLELAFLGPVRNPELARRFGTTARGGLLLYGPPGCGKTFIARAVAGELGAKFVEIGIADVLDMWVGRSERNLAELFRTARRNAPCVLFLDEVDALGQKRSNLTHSGSLRNTVNQLLAELDSATGANDGVFVLGATNHPWDLDSALRRPGRFDRMLLVLPPDAPARAAILRHHLRDRPVAELDLAALVKATEHYSGADLAHVCDTAAERALALSMRSGTVQPLTTRDLLGAAREVTPSTGPWFAAARNVALFGNTDGSYDELAAYLKRNRSL